MNAEELKVTITDPSATEKLLEIEIPRKNFDSIYNEKVKKYSKELKLNGYRKGTIPKRIIAERFNEPLTNETLEKLVDDVIKEVCRNHSINPVAPGRVEELKNENQKPIILKAVIEIDQEVDIISYKNLGITQKAPEAVTEADVTAEISKHLENFATEEPKEVGDEGDIAFGEYLSIEIDGQETPLPENKSFRIEIGSDKIPEFNQAFKGSKVGEEKAITVNYPSEYNVSDLAGKSGNYKIKIISITQKIKPEIDDELAKKFGTEDLADLQTKIRENLTKTRQSEVRHKAEIDVIEKILESSPFDIPKARIDHYIEYQIHGDDYDASQGHHHHPEISPEQRAKMEAQANFVLKKYRILEIVGAKEKIKPSQEEVDAKIQELAEQNNLDFDMLKNSLRKDGRINDLREELKSKLTMDLILNG